MLGRLGSKRSQQIGWRDMWAFVTIKGSPKRLLGESLSKSPDFSSWGQNVVLRSEVPLASLAEANCQKWSNSEENKRRRQFCDHVEGYGSVCDCDNPAPIDELSTYSSPVLNNQVLASWPSNNCVSNGPLLGVRYSRCHHSFEPTAIFVSNASLPFVSRRCQPFNDHRFHWRLLYRAFSRGQIVWPSWHSSKKIKESFHRASCKNYIFSTLLSARGMQEFLSITKPHSRLLSTFILKPNMSLSWKKILTSHQVRITSCEFTDADG